VISYIKQQNVSLPNLGYGFFKINMFFIGELIQVGG